MQQRRVLMRRRRQLNESYAAALVFSGIRVSHSIEVSKMFLVMP